MKILSESKKKSYILDEDSLTKLENIRVYLEKKYGIDTLTGAIKYLIRKGEELSKENKL